MLTEFTATSIDRLRLLLEVEVESIGVAKRLVGLFFSTPYLEASAEAFLRGVLTLLSGVRAFALELFFFASMRLSCNEEL